MGREQGFQRIIVVVSLVVLIASLWLVGDNIYRISHYRAERLNCIGWPYQTRPPTCHGILTVETPIWWTWDLSVIAAIGVIISAALASIPWGLFYLLRWIIHGFSN